MQLTVNTVINASKEDVWQIITDIENAQNTISGIEIIEILEQPKTGIIGLKWKETRTLFGKTATEIMWITDAVDYHFYKTRAESHGAIYITTLTLSEQNHQTRLSMEFSGEPQTFVAKILSQIMGIFFEKATKQALMQDLLDIKAAAEKFQ